MKKQRLPFRVFNNGEEVARVDDLHRAAKMARDLAAYSGIPVIKVGPSTANAFQVWPVRVGGSARNTRLTCHQGMDVASMYQRIHDEKDRLAVRLDEGTPMRSKSQAALAQFLINQFSLRATA